MENYKKYSYLILITLTGILLSYILLKYLLPIFLPFIISFFLVSLVRPLINKISSKTNASKFFVTIFIIFLAMTIFGVGIGFALITIAEQIGDIFESLAQNLSQESNYVTSLFFFIEKIENKLPFVNSLTNESVYTLVTEMMSESIKNLSVRVTSAVAKAIISLPQIMITLIVMILSLFYFAKDYEKIGVKIVSLLPSSVSQRAPQIKNDILLVVSKYLKSYILLMLITFAELFVGLLILGIRNSFVLALIISFVDILPILGVGTVLIPWAVIMAIGGQTKVAIGILILFLVIYIVRQYAEPRIVSAQMEVHPLITLIAMYTGLKLAGLLGLIFAPLIAFVVKTSYTSFKKEKTVDKKE